MTEWVSESRMARRHTRPTARWSRRNGCRLSACAQSSDAGSWLKSFCPRRDNVVILTHVYWQRRFGADPAVIGRSLRIDGRPTTIVGVLPPNVLRYGADLLRPLVIGTYPPSREYRNLDVVARLRPEATIASAQAALDVLARQLDLAYSSPNVNREFSVAQLGKNYASIGPGAEQSLMLMLGAVALVLLIACVNVANLLLARAITRERECAIRSALGASRGRLSRQLLIENLLLFVAGGGLGCFLAWWSLDFMTALGVSGGYIPERLLVSLDARVLGFATLVTLITAATFGLAPALRGAAVSVSQGLKEASQNERGGSSRARTRRVLIVAELALSVVLLVGCGLIVRSLLGLYANVNGFVPDRLLETGSDAGREFAPALMKWRAALERARGIPGVESAALSSRPPIHGARLQSFSVSGRPAVDHALEPRAGDILISPDYFRTMGIPLRRGRAFTELDAHTSTPVVIISETLARQQFPGEDPIGQRIRINERSPLSCCVVAAPVDGVWREIVGSGRRHPPGQSGRSARGDDLPPLWPDFRTRHVPAGPDADRSRYRPGGRGARDRAAQRRSLDVLVAGSIDAPEHRGVRLGSNPPVRGPRFCLASRFWRWRWRRSGCTA